MSSFVNFLVKSLLGSLNLSSVLTIFLDLLGHYQDDPKKVNYLYNEVFFDVLIAGLVIGAAIEGGLHFSPSLENKILKYYRSLLKIVAASELKTIWLRQLLVEHGDCRNVGVYSLCGASGSAVNITAFMQIPFFPLSCLAGWSEYRRYQGGIQVGEWYKGNTKKIFEVLSTGLDTFLGGLALLDVAQYDQAIIKTAITGKSYIDLNDEVYLPLKVIAGTLAGMTGAWIEYKFQADPHHYDRTKKGLFISNQFFQSLLFLSFTLVLICSDLPPRQGIPLAMPLAVLFSMLRTYQDYKTRFNPAFSRNSFSNDSLQQRKELESQEEFKAPLLSQPLDIIGPSSEENLLAERNEAKAAPQEKNSWSSSLYRFFCVRKKSSAEPSANDINLHNEDPRLTFN